ncbi:MAG: hypothetical protein AAGC74_09020 [Verrucomicrobiota bacterium]
MNLHSLFALILTLLPLHAAEHTLKPSPFKVTWKFEGTLLPTKTQIIELKPEGTPTFVLEETPEQGKFYKKGEPLFLFKTEDLENQTQTKQDDLRKKELAFQIANRELAELSQKNALALTKAKNTLDDAETDLAYFEEVGKPARIESAEESLHTAELYLTYEKEELEQLLKMYEEDDLTEETEEIILVRQRNAVRRSEYALKRQKRTHDLTLSTSIPREERGLKAKVEETRIAYATAKTNLERKYELKKLDVAASERELEQARKDLAKYQQDLTLMDLKAEFDGYLYFGEFTDGIWNKGKSVEALRKGKNLPLHRPIATLVAADSPLSLHSLHKPQDAKKLQALLTTNPDLSPEIASFAERPNPNNQHLISLRELPAEPFQFPGLKSDKTLTFYQKDDALTVPNSAVHKRDDDSNFVKVKLSEGKPEERTIELGQQNETHTEILSGLEAGQVVLFPEEKKKADS